MIWCKKQNLDPFEEDQLPPNIRKIKVPRSDWLDMYKQKN